MDTNSETRTDTSKRGKILIVEDVHYMRLLLRQTLVAMGYEVLEARDGNQASLTYQENQKEIVLILTDIVMPDANGIEGIQKIRAISKKVPILVVTANPSKENLVACAKLGISGVVSKPFERNRFRAKVLELLSVNDSQLSSESQE